MTDEELTSHLLGLLDPFVHFTAADGFRATRIASSSELAARVMVFLAPELARARLADEAIPLIRQLRTFVMSARADVTAAGADDPETQNEGQDAANELLTEVRAFLARWNDIVNRQQ